MEEIKSKIKFVSDISKTVVKYVAGISSVDYIVFKNKKNNYTQEFVKVTFNSGGFSIRTCNGNSFAAVLYEISKLLDGGYYCENDFYEKCCSNDELEII